MESKHILPADIERTSMKIITAELAERGLTVPDNVRPVVLRVIHTTADFDYAENLRFSEGAVEAGIAVLAEGTPIVTDTNMALSGVSKPSLKKLGGSACCFMADPEIAVRAKEQGTTRAAASMIHASEQFPSAVFAVGNAPTALMTLSDLIRGGYRPALVIAVPVGFVNVEDSKEEIFALCEEKGIPVIAAMGRKGGSNVAASICNALLYSATESLDPAARGWQG